jgi:predicted RNA-binding protein (virulence factor B family)
MLKIGNYNTLKVVKEVDFGLYLESGKGEILIPSKYVPQNTRIGDELEVFVYTDSEDRLIATTLSPIAVVGEFAAMTVKDVTDFGAFLDWGIQKDLLVPNNEQHRKLYKGQKTVVRVCLDPRTDRVVGVGKLGPFLSKDTSELEEKQEVSLLIYEETDLGYMAIIDNQYAGMLYRNEVFEPLEVGDTRLGYIRKIREDGKIDLRLNKEGVAAIVDGKDIVLNKLKSEGGFLPYHDKTDADVIKEVFQISKKTFKKAIGGLYRDGSIVLLENGIKLNR